MSRSVCRHASPELRLQHEMTTASHSRKKNSQYFVHRAVLVYWPKRVLLVCVACVGLGLPIYWLWPTARPPLLQPRGHLILVVYLVSVLVLCNCSCNFCAVYFLVLSILCTRTELAALLRTAVGCPLTSGLGNESFRFSLTRCTCFYCFDHTYGLLKWSYRICFQSIDFFVMFFLILLSGCCDSSRQTTSGERNLCRVGMK